MEYVIDYNPDKNCVLIKVKGKLSFKLAEQYSIEALKLARQNNCHKFLINHEETELEDAGNYKLHTNGAALEKFGFRNTDNIAVVILRIKDDSLFLKKIEHNAKWSNSKYFDNVEDALNWLDAAI